MRFFTTTIENKYFNSGCNETHPQPPLKKFISIVVVMFYKVFNVENNTLQSKLYNMQKLDSSRYH